jgi:hypothetical protein
MSLVSDTRKGKRNQKIKQIEQDDLYWEESCLCSQELFMVPRLLNSLCLQGGAMSKESGSEKQILIKSENTDDYNLLPADGNPSAAQVPAPAHSRGCDTRKAEVFKHVHGRRSKYNSDRGLELGIVPPLQTSTAGGGSSGADGFFPRVCKLDPLEASDASPPRPPVKKLKPESTPQGIG